MACRLPVVISKQCFFPQVAEVGAGYEVDLNAKSLSDAILQVVADDQQCTRMGQAGRQLVQQRYQWSMVARQTIEMYEQALADVKAR